jgi:DNA topoisomerase-1
MPRKLLIVESPAKARTLGKFLGSDFNVKASVGHVRDLPKSSLGVDEAAGFEPQYVVLDDKEKIVAELRRAARSAEEVYLATDPDREGEAICWHIAELLKGSVNGAVQRVEFHEITRQAVEEAIASPRSVDMDRVDAQQARRVIDRLVGYQISPLLWDKVKRGLSAGRVQSVALKMICDREAEIDAFVPEEYWTVEALVRASEAPDFVIKLAKRGQRKWRPTCEAEARHVEAAVKNGPLRVAKVVRKQRTQSPKPPFITSHLQQEASRRLRLPVRRTMQIAQRLYEGADLGEQGRIGLITYMRTDSVRVSAESVAMARELIAERWGAAAVPDKPNSYRNRSSAQDAHEAIRPTDVRLTPETVAAHLSADELRLYRLIWERFVASQMARAVFDVTQVEVEASEYTLAASGKIVRDPGFLRLWKESDDSGNGDDAALPQRLEAEEQLTCRRVDLEQRFTQPPPRYTEASLVKALEENGIGRPSTYASILATLSTRDYVLRDKGSFLPTELGKVVNRLLVGSFAAIINEAYTAALESELDTVAEGKERWRDLVQRFSDAFKRDLEAARLTMEQVKGKGIATDHSCPECSSPLVLKFGRYGEFLACSAYPSCTYTRDLREEKPPEESPEEVPRCPECEAEMVLKRSRFGPFWACTRYPECRGTRRVGASKTPSKPEPTGVSCPEDRCEGEIVARKSRRGRVFYGCSRYPKCSYSMWDPPVATACPECGHKVMGLKETKRRGRELVCPDKSCGHREPAPEADPD